MPPSEQPRVSPAQGSPCTLVPWGSFCHPEPQCHQFGVHLPELGKWGSLEGELTPVGACPTTGDFGVPWLGGCSHDIGGEFEGTNPTQSLGRWGGTSGGAGLGPVGPSPGTGAAGDVIPGPELGKGAGLVLGITGLVLGYTGLLLGYTGLPFGVPGPRLEEAAAGQRGMWGRGSPLAPRVHSFIQCRAPPARGGRGSPYIRGGAGGAGGRSRVAPPLSSSAGPSAAPPHLIAVNEALGGWGRAAPLRPPRTCNTEVGCV